MTPDLRPGPAYSAALSGFGVVWAHPRVIVAWGLVCLAFEAAESLFGAVSAGPAISRIVQMASRPNPDPDKVAALLVQIAPTYFVLLSATMVFFAVFFAAANRAIDRPDDDRFAYLAFGKEELRQLGLVIVLFATSLGLYLVIGLVAGLAGSALAMAAGQSFGLAAAVVLVLGSMGYVWFRFSLASPLTYATGRIDLLGSWRLTRGRGAAMARAYLLGLACIAVVYLLGLTVIVALLGAAFGGLSQVETLAQPDFSSLAGVFSPPRVVLAVLQSALTALLLPLALCPAVVIYRAANGPSDRIGRTDQVAGSPTQPWGGST